MDWTRSHYKDNNKFIFINSWNNWNEGSYLEPDSKYGFANLNSLSKALFNLPLKEKNYYLSKILNVSNIAVHAHIFYEDLIEEIINKTNNIPVKYDLFISTNSLNKSLIIENYTKIYSKCNKLYIRIFENKGRDVLPFLNQLKFKIKSYKYICHIHTKKTMYSPDYGLKWRNYLYRNLLGTVEIVSEILSDFEKNDNLGFIFPETFYECIKFSLNLKKLDKKYLNLILNKIFPGHQIGKTLDFPAGNMFWARIESIYQIFDIKIENMFPNEENQINGTIMHGIERIWLFLVKLNGYLYKKIFKNF